MHLHRIREPWLTHSRCTRTDAIEWVINSSSSTEMPLARPSTACQMDSIANGGQCAKVMANALQVFSRDPLGCITFGHYIFPCPSSLLLSITGLTCHMPIDTYRTVIVNSNGNKCIWSWLIWYTNRALVGRDRVINGWYFIENTDIMKDELLNCIKN